MDAYYVGMSGCTNGMPREAVDLLLIQLTADFPGTCVRTVLADVQESHRLGIRGTPRFLLNGLLLRGMPKRTVFKQVVELEGVDQR